MKHRSTLMARAALMVVFLATASPRLGQSAPLQAGAEASGALTACATYFLERHPYRCIGVAVFEEGPCEGGLCLASREPSGDVMARLRRRFPALRSANDPACEASDREILWVRPTESGEGWPSPWVAVWEVGRIPGFDAATGCEASRGFLGRWKVKLHPSID